MEKRITKVALPNFINPVAAIHYSKIGGCAMCKSNLDDPYLIKLSDGKVILLCDDCGPNFLALTGFTGKIACSDRLSGLIIHQQTQHT